MSQNNKIPVSRDDSPAAASPAGPQYLLASHVHICVTGDHAILLDLKRDKYIGVTPAQMEVLAALVKGWPSRDAISTPILQRSGTGAAAVVDKMIAAGMLTSDPANGREALPLVMARLESTLTKPDLEYRPRIAAGHVARFLFASAFARLSLKWRPIERVVARVDQRKKRRAPAGKKTDLDAARPLVEAFLYLRPLFFTVKDACLFDSLALVEFLAGYGFFPQWVIGVQTAPFRAHSWVQEGDVVFNDTPDYVRRFVPILAI